MCHSDVIFAVHKVWISRIDYVCIHTYTYTMEYDVITNFISWRSLFFFFFGPYHFFFRYCLNTKSRQTYQHEFLVAGWNAFINRYVFYKFMVHQLYIWCYFIKQNSCCISVSARYRYISAPIVIVYCRDSECLPHKWHCSCLELSNAKQNR